MGASSLTVELYHQRETFGRGCWLVDIVSGDPEKGSLHCEHFRSRACAGAFRKGAMAAISGVRFQNPYVRPGYGVPRRGMHGLCRAFYHGHEAAQDAMRQERPPC